MKNLKAYITVGNKIDIVDTSQSGVYVSNKLTLTGHSDKVWSVSFSSDGKYLASGSQNNTVRLWNVDSGALVKTLTGPSSWVTSVSFSSDGKYLARLCVMVARFGAILSPFITEYKLPGDSDAPSDGLSTLACIVLGTCSIASSVGLLFIRNDVHCNDFDQLSR
ncbi:hypothetical protein MIR68_011820 [Amoeboaphelidium protococcarum]|nr:hypothetical protein MIR68_011820 [Amoeboaphelidium protococcarum]